MTPEQRAACLEEWVLSRPPAVQKAAREWPVGSWAIIEQEMHYIVGYTDDAPPMLIFSPVNPSQDYELAMRRKIYVCAKHLDGASRSPI